MKKLAIVTTHPIQYNAPFFKMLSGRGKVEVKVFYTWGKKVLEKKFDPGFGKTINWDIPLLEGYNYEFVENVAKEPGSHHHNGIINPGLRQQVIDWQPDAVLVYGWNLKSHFQLLQNKIPNCLLMFRGDSTNIHHKGIKSYVRAKALCFIFRKVDYALYVGSHNKNYFEQAGFKEDKLIFVPHAVDNDRFYSKLKTCGQELLYWRNSLGIEQDKIVFLYAGKLDGNKNVALLLEAFVALDNPKSALMIVGNGEKENELKTVHAKNRQIHFLPFQNQDQMPLVYGLCDVFVLPSISETWGLALNEAMACGKAIVASSGCGAAVDLVEDGINGHVFNNNDVNDLKKKLESMMDKTIVAKMGLQSLKKVEFWSYHNDCMAVEKLLS